MRISGLFNRAVSVCPRTPVALFAKNSALCKETQSGIESGAKAEATARCCLLFDRLLRCSFFPRYQFFLTKGIQFPRTLCIEAQDSQVTVSNWNILARQATRFALKGRVI